MLWNTKQDQSLWKLKIDGDSFRSIWFRVMMTFEVLLPLSWIRFISWFFLIFIIFGLRWWFTKENRLLLTLNNSLMGHLRFLSQMLEVHETLGIHRNNQLIVVVKVNPEGFQIEIRSMMGTRFDNDMLFVLFGYGQTRIGKC